MLSKEQFEFYIDTIKDFTNIETELYYFTNNSIDIAKLYGADNGKLSPDLALASLLELCMHDTNGLIGKWCFMYDFGNLVEKDIENFNIKTVEGLYNQLVMEGANNVAH